MTLQTLDLDPIQSLILEAFSVALAQLDSASALPTGLREEINQVGEALANYQADAVVRLENIARKYQPLYDRFEAAYDALDETIVAMYFRGRQAPPKADAKRVLPVLPPRQILSLLTIKQAGAASLVTSRILCVVKKNGLIVETRPLSNVTSILSKPLAEVFE